MLKSSVEITDNSGDMNIFFLQDFHCINEMFWGIQQSCFLPDMSRTFFLQCNVMKILNN